MYRILPPTSRLLFMVIFSMSINRVHSRFDPQVTVESCTNSELKLHLMNASQEGLVFIQGRGSACKHTTTSTPQQLTFDFGVCDIQYDVVFRVVVQKRQEVQTGDDRVIPIMCMLDISDILVNGVVFPGEGIDSAGVNKTEKPKAHMRVFSHSVDVSKGVVTLNDPLGMEIKLDEDYQDSFDIRAKDCTAAVIPIIRHECAPDSELFPNFEKKNRGTLESSFRAFQPTNLNGEAEADVIFTCQLSVCRGDCQRNHCSGNSERMRRSTDEVNEITVGTRIRVISPQQNQTLEEIFLPSLCMERLFVYLIAILVGIVMLGSWAVIGYLISRLVSSGIKPDLEVARSVGRRLSSMLNLPKGYNFKDPKRFDCIPEEEGMTPPQQRRKSVTVGWSNKIRQMVKSQ